MSLGGDAASARVDYCPAPRTLPAFPKAAKVLSKTPIRGGGLRKRWKDDDGTIYEWDYAHGTVEKYDSRGHHQGEFDPHNGKQLKPALPFRRVEP
jgi:Cytotoxic